MNDFDLNEFRRWIIRNSDARLDKVESDTLIASLSRFSNLSRMAECCTIGLRGKGISMEQAVGTHINGVEREIALIDEGSS